MAAIPIKLSWKQWMRSLSLLVYPVIFRQYIVRWAIGHVPPLNFSNSGVLNLCGRTKSETKVSSAASIPFNALSHSIAFNLSSRSLYFCCASVLSTWTTSPFPDLSCSLGSSGSCTNIGLMKLPPGLTLYFPDSCTCPIDGVAWGNVDAPIGGEGIGYVSWVV